MSRLRTRRCRAMRGQSGMSLLEVLLVVGMIGLILGPIASWVVLGMDQDVATRSRNSDAASIGMLRSVFVKDVASAKAVVAGSAAAGSDCPGGAGAATSAEDTVLRLRRDAERTVVYNVSSTPGEATASVYRRLCTNGSLERSTKVAGRVAQAGLVASCSARPNAPVTDCGRVNLRVTTVDAELVSMTASIRVGADVTATNTGPVYVSPDVVLTAAPTTVYRGESVSLEASQSVDPRGQALSFNWDFGDGSPVGTSPDVDHTFGALGEFTVVLTVTNSDGTPASDFVRIEVLNRLPTAVMAQPADPVTTNMCTDVTFDATGSNDDGDTGYGGGTIVSYEWDYGDGTSASLQSVSHSRKYQRPSPNGPFTARVEVVDDDGGRSAAVTRPVTVENRLPSVSIAANGSTGTVQMTLGAPVHFTSQASDPDSDCDGGSLAYEWDFGDGNTSADANPDHVYNSAPTGDVTLKVTDRWGGERTSNRISVSSNRAPATAFTFAPSSPRAGDLVTFTNGTTDPDGDPVTYSWAFQHLGPTYTSPSTVTSPAVKFTHDVTGDTFISGTYDVTLTASDPKGGSKSLTKTVTVTGAPKPSTPGINVKKRCVSGPSWLCLNYDWDNTVSWTAVPSVSGYQVEAKWQHCHLWCEGWVSTTVSVTGTSRLFTIVNPGNMQARVRALDLYTGKYGAWSDWKIVGFS